ncbi:Lcl C-terminal domain-containing protein [Leptospira sp. GIMC2001]|uniref:Lcl C-terminal domain-containing protein n=1 Tax=Leptospira sp. GIMC2001 TaxID=1513297 RepID=UPI00234A8AE0|nr:DUF1566 domain-containing protein [Leptospira sp. GIMC2001]WCL49702.1 DUF1566 domain-containing protein [Leptospira sp. GIMC2001]
MLINKLSIFISLSIFLYATQIASAPYIDNGDGTVKDVATGLTWRSCTNGLSGNNCGTGSLTTYTWENAISACSSPWRLPSINELKTIVDTAKTSNPTIESTVFPGTITGSPYWSSTTYAINTTIAWYILFNTGSVSYNAKTNSYVVRCVTGP